MGRAKGMTQGSVPKRFDPFGAIMGRRRGRPIPALLSPNDDIARMEFRGLMDDMHMGYEFPYFLEIIDDLQRDLSGPGEHQDTYLRLLAEDISRGLLSEAKAGDVLAQHFESLHVPPTDEELRDVRSACEASLAEGLLGGHFDSDPILTLDDGTDLARIIMAIEVGKVAAGAIFEDLDLLVQVVPDRYNELTNMARRMPIPDKTPDEMFHALGRRCWEQILANALQRTSTPDEVEAKIVKGAETRLQYLAERLRQRDAAPFRARGT